MRSLAIAAFLVPGCSSPEGPSARPAPTEQPAAAQPDTPDVVPATTSVAPEPDAPVPSPAATAAHASVQAALNGDPLAAHPEVHFAPIEDPSGVALRSFHAALRDLQAGTAEGNKVRVAFYGASSVAADRYPAYLRGYLQHRFGDGGVGFVALVPLWRWHRHDALRLDANARWRIEHGQRETGKLDGFYGLLGASAHSDDKRARSTLIPRGDAICKLADSDSFALQFLAQPGGGTFTLSFGKGKKAPVETFDTQAESPTLRTLPVPLPERFLPMTVAASGDGEVRLMGGIFERSQAGVVVDALGIGGTRSANMLNWDTPMWTQALHERAPALYVLAYGANESVDEDEPIEIYRKNLEAVLERFAAAAPEASCVLVGPVDYPLQDEESQAWGVRSRLREILAVQREVATARGCGFFDTSRLTGGLGSMPAWVAADPKLAKDDHLHLTPLGYLHFGRVLSDALMADFDGPPRAAR